MTSSLRRSLTTAAVCGVLVSVQIFVVALPSRPANATSCSALRAWAASYRGANPTLDNLATFDRPHRRALFNAVTSQVRAALWQQQLRRFNERRDLTPVQHQLIARAMTLATPALYGREPGTSEAVDALWSEADKAFASSEQRRFWFDLGAGVPARSTVWDRIVRPLQANAQDNLCECNTAFGWLECPSGGCLLGGCHMEIACGPLGNKPCNGMCAP